jgi:hypothetical protein
MEVKEEHKNALSTVQFIANFSDICRQHHVFCLTLSNMTTCALETPQRQHLYPTAI